MSKRYYFPNKEITVQGMKEKYTLSVTSDGTVYHDSGRGFRKLQALWFPKTQTLSVSLPDESEIKLRPVKGELTVVGEEKKEDDSTSKESKENSKKEIDEKTTVA